ncbi:hypothetical protein N7474_004402 [Penicillium riverlandense]|uniref:uncharacterized protein n=1 Tax=Penicillium riverlandense TaxID=1903569 RepID=UPI002548F1EC|nr:uncharacterized protein N7474_004402 [Penicillium riverlandense]KAJ5818811.1 hypothetical protein N7474_004402 [Penicillium riverlandense]
MSTQDKLPSEYTFRACLVIAGAFTSLFCTVGFLNSFGIFEEYYAAAQLAHKSSSTIAWIGAVSIFFLFAISVASGAMVDIFGPGIMLYIGATGTVFSVMMVSLCKEYYQFLLAQGVLLGISMALVTWPMLALVGQYMKRKRAAAMGIVVAGSSLGGVVWPVAIERLLQNPHIGFPWTMRIVGFIMLLCLLFTCVAARSPDKQENNSMEQGTGHESVAVKSEKEVPKPDHKTAALALFKQPSLQLLCLAMFITYFGLFSPLVYTTSYAVHEGFSESLSFYTVSIINGASFFGRILPGILADKYGKFNCCIVASLSSGIAAMCWAKVTSVPGLVIWSAAYGFSSGAILSLQQACAAQVATSDTIGLAIGSVVGSTSLSAMVGVPISGALAAKYSYLSLSIYAGVSLILGGVLLVASRLAQNRQLRAII